MNSGEPGVAVARSFGGGWPDRGRWLGAIGFALLVAWALNLAGVSASKVDVILEARTSAGTDGEIFYSSGGEEYSPERSIPFALISDGQWHEYVVELPIKNGIERIRVDPGRSAGEFSLRRIDIAVPGARRTLVGASLAGAKGTENQMRLHAVAGDAGELVWVLDEPDPFVDFTLPKGAGRVDFRSLFNYWFGIIVAAAGAWIVLTWLVPLGWRRLPTRRWGPEPWLMRGARFMSDEGILIVSPKAAGVVVALLLSAVVYVGLNLHQSSIGVWEEMYPARPVDQMIDLGSPKHIRSDEWNTQSPWVLSQVANGYESRNPSVGGAGAPLIASLPVGGPAAVLQPKYYGFHLFGVETGFSWWWAYKTFGLLLSFFWLCALLTRGQVVISCLGAVWVYGSSFTQWWFSSNLPEILIGFACAVIGAAYLMFGRRRRWMTVGAGLIGFSALNLMMHPYPPFIIPLAYLGVALIVGLALEDGRWASFRSIIVARGALLLGAVALAGVAAFLYVRQALPTIEIMLATSYPGHRISESGEFSLVRQFSGYFEGLRSDGLYVPFPPTNASEASSFIILAPFVFAVVKIKSLLRRSGALIAVLGAYCLVVGAWVGLSLPGPFEWVLQKIGWGWVPGARAMLGFGLGSVLASIVLLSRMVSGDIQYRSASVRLMFVLMVVPLLLVFGGWLQAIDPNFFTLKVLLIGTLASACMVAGIGLGRLGVFAFGLIMALLPSLMVNPLVSGLSAILEKPVLSAANDADDPNSDTWAVVGNFVFSQGLKARGLHVVTGSKMVPDRALVDELDPSGAYTDVWNRYAHVVFESAPALPEPAFTLLHPDMYRVSLNVCGKQMDRLGVTRLAYTDAVPESDLACLRELPAPADSAVRLFVRLPGTTDSNDAPGQTIQQETVQ
ncbi:hypothetical protein LYB30171_02312 [Lysobacter luteus]|uniref:Glycosyltransferase RgtA/B/C/D-like domain-containing protein n=2 Tax=Novilysobacter luteus TaxID=2822368 RepID=A0ABN7R4V9_9GAMM|nr:hypothetical protein LYB30171_02312 [Lysobacter luteus]